MYLHSISIWGSSFYSGHIEFWNDDNCLVRLSQDEWQELLLSLSEGEGSVTLGETSLTLSEVQAQKLLNAIRHLAAVYGGEAAPPDDNPAWYWSAQIIP